MSQRILLPKGLRELRKEHNEQHQRRKQANFQRYTHQYQRRRRQ
jgi:hypothetical protein